MKKNIIISFVLITVITFFYFDLSSFLNLTYIKEQQIHFQSYAQLNPWQARLGFFFLYVAITSLSLPGATILTLLGGALFGLVWGGLLVSLASTAGATLAFLLSRYLLKDIIQNKFKSKLQTINAGIKKDGGLYLFSLRLIPIFPFFLINIVLGLTPIKAITYILTSLIGMLPGTLVYVNAGTQLAKIDSLDGLLSPNLILSFVLLGAFPIIAKKTMSYFISKKI